MRVAFFDTHQYDRQAFAAANQAERHELHYLEPRLKASTAPLAAGYAAVCSFVNDRVDGETLRILASGGTKVIALRCAGFNHVDLGVAKELGIKILRVPEYSPYAVAEHTVALILALNRRIHRAFNRVRELNFSLDGLVGFDLHGRTVGIVGTGRIGVAFARIMRGFGCRVLAHDRNENEALAKEVGFRYVPMAELLRDSDIVSLHVPLTPATHHMIDEKAFAVMKPSVMLINTSRGGLVDAQALITALKQKRIQAAGLDVYEEEEGIFFQNLSETVLQDDVLARLLTFPNVLITSHQAFLTHEALGNIAATTLENLSSFEEGRPLPNEVS